MQFAKQDCFDHKVMLCFWWNFEHLPNELAVNTELHSAQLERLHNILRVLYPAPINRKPAFLQHNNARRSCLMQYQVSEFDGIDVLPHPVYSPDLMPNEYYLFRSIVYFLRGQHIGNLKEVENGFREFFALKPAEWYRCGIQHLAER